MLAFSLVFSCYSLIWFPCYQCWFGSDRKPYLVKYSMNVLRLPENIDWKKTKVGVSDSIGLETQHLH